MKPEIQNRINEVKYECGMDIATLKKVNGIETALRWVQRGVFGLGIRYFISTIAIVVILSLAYVGGADRNLVKPIQNIFIEQPIKKLDNNDMRYWVYSNDKEENEKIKANNSTIYSIINITYIFGIPLIVVFLFDLLVNAPRRRQLKKLGEEGFLKHYAIANGLPQDLFEVRRK